MANILICDDDTDFLKQIKSMLENNLFLKQEFEMIYFTSGKDIFFIVHFKNALKRVYLKMIK